MLDEYRALWPVLRGPMARWWRRTGAWWMAALLFLAVLSEAVSAALIPHFALSPGQPGALTGWLGLDESFWRSTTGVLGGLLYLTAMLTAVMAASACLRLAATLLRDFPDPAAASRHSPLFLCALRQAIWPLAVIALLQSTGLFEIIHYCLFGSKILHGWKLVYVLHGILHDMPLNAILHVTWLVAVLTAMRPRLALVMVWLIGIYIASTGFQLLYGSPYSPSWFHVFTDVPTYGTAVPTSYTSHLHCGWLVGATLMILLIRSSLRGRIRWSYAVGSLVILASLIANFYIAVPINMPKRGTSKYNEILGLPVRTAISWSVDTLRYANSFATNTFAWYERRQRTGSFPVKPQDWGYFINSAVPCWWSIEVAPSPLFPLVLLPVVNAAYLALVIWFIAAVLLRVRAKVARAP
jgi:hypothetical protein